MVVFLVILAALTFLGGISFLINAKSAIHEIEGLICLSGAIMCIVGAGVMQKLNDLIMCFKVGNSHQNFEFKIHDTE